MMNFTEAQIEAVMARGRMSREAAVRLLTRNTAPGPAVVAVDARPQPGDKSSPIVTKEIKS